MIGKMLSFSRRRHIRRSAKAIFLLGLVVLAFVFIVLPTIFHYCFTVQRHMVFLPWVKWPKHVDFDRPEDEGLLGTRNFYLDTDKGVRVGVWHVLPNRLIADGQDKQAEWFEQSLSRAETIVFYFHGNTGSRAREHRMAMYDVLRQMNYHVICFDYRGYADSSSVIPTKRGVIRDARSVYAYIKRHAPSTPLIVWGHSLGSAVSSQLVADLSQEAEAEAEAGRNSLAPPTALILESPFSNIMDEIRVHPMTYLWRKMPRFEWFFTGTLNKSDVAFLTDEAVKKIHIPILILHAKDDHVIPFELGLKLYSIAKESRDVAAAKAADSEDGHAPLDLSPAHHKDNKPVIFIPFDAELGYGHVNIYLAPDLPDIVKHFITNSIKDSWKPTDYLRR